MIHISPVRPLLEDTENTGFAGLSPPLFHEDSSKASVPPDIADNCSMQQLPTTQSGRVIGPVDSIMVTDLNF